MTATRERLCSSISPLRIPLDSELPCFVSGVCTVSNEVMNHAYNHRVRAECCDVHPRKGVAYGQGRLDRNAFIRKTLCELFTRDADFEVCGEAENGREAIEKAQELRPDLIVLDLSMPVMNGLDAARVLKRIMPTVPLIMYSAFGDFFARQNTRNRWESPNWSRNPSTRPC